MLTQKTVKNNSMVFSGLQLAESSGTITISSGSTGNYSLDGVTFDLTPDASLLVDYSLYLTLSNKIISPVLERTVLDGVAVPIYGGSDQLYHRIIKLTLQPDGTYEGDFVTIVKEDQATNNPPKPSPVEESKS